MNEKDECPFKAEIERLKDDVKKNANNIERNENDIHLIDKQQTKTDVQYDNIMKVLNDVCKKVESIITAPAKKWDKLTWAVLMIIVSALVSGAIAFIK